ncbi:hypothetical protein HON71_01710 [Candidatus Woesearchaeota archaeon]|jgi:hypothetical protein|nr:hypothetical protein [Candidatus Woesearchaeota archaeon]MBT5342425.1 hypothetical protein [Candidatus Woesearchaeota archaeon]
MTEEIEVTDKVVKQTRNFYMTVTAAIVAIGVGGHYVTEYLESEIKQGIHNKIDQLKKEIEVDFYGEPKADFMARPVVDLEGIAHGNHETYVAPVITEHSTKYKSWTESTLSMYIVPFKDQDLGFVTIEVLDSSNVPKETIDTKITNKCLVTTKAREVSPKTYKAFAADIDVKSCLEYSLLHKL